MGRLDTFFSHIKNIQIILYLIQLHCILHLIPRHNNNVEKGNLFHKLHKGIKSKGMKTCDILITSDKINNSTINELEENAIVKIIDLKNYK